MLQRPARQIMGIFILGFQQQAPSLLLSVELSGLGKDITTLFGTRNIPFICIFVLKFFMKVVVIYLSIIIFFPE